MLVGPHSTAARARGVPRQDPRRPAQLHRPADAGAVAAAVLHRRSRRAAPRRSPALRALWREGHGRARRADARGAQERIAGRELLAGRRQQGHLGARKLIMDRRAMLLSRVADALYWISRYLERAEHTARLMDVRLDLGLDRLPSGDGWDFERLFAALRPAAARRRAGSPAALIDSWSSISTTRTRSCPASRRRARTRARCGKRSTPTCGNS